MQTKSHRKSIPVIQKEIPLEVCCVEILTSKPRGWSGGAMVLGKLPVPGRPTNLDFSRERAYCACNRSSGG